MRDPPFRYVVAIVPPQAIAQRIGRLRDELPLLGAPVVDRRLILSLVTVPTCGTRDPALAVAVGDALAGFVPGRCAVRLDRLLLDQTAALVVTATETPLHRLQASLAARLACAAEPPQMIVGHSPRGRGRRPAGPFVWAADALALVECGGPRATQRIAGGWPLIAPPPPAVQYGFDFGS